MLRVFLIQVSFSSCKRENDVGFFYKIITIYYFSYTLKKWWKTMLNILKITIYLLFMQEKGDENYVNFFDKKIKIYLFIYFMQEQKW